MKINRLEINGFGKLENRSFIFGPGMNVIYGCNESGKSTLQAFIKAMLFGLKGGRRTKEGFLPPAKQYKPWTARMYGGTIEYELDDGRKYFVNRNFENNTLAVYDEHSNNITGEFPAGKDEGVRFAEQHLGLSENCFIRTVFIGQLQSVVDSEGKKVLAERMTNIRQSGDEEVSYRKAVKALKEAQLSYVGSERSTTRPLNIISSRLEEAIREEQAAAKLHEDSVSIFIELDKAKKDEAVLNKELEALLSERKKLQDIAEIKSLRNMVQTLEEYIRKLDEINLRIREIKNEIKRVETQMATLKNYEKFSQEDIGDVAEDNARFVYIDEDYRRILRQKEELEEKIKEDEDILSEYDIFNKYGTEIDTVLDKILNDEYGKAGMDQHDGAEKRNHEKKRLKTRRIISAAGVIFSFLLLLSTVLIPRYYLKNAYLPLLITGVTAFAGMGALFLYTIKKQKLLLIEDDAKKREYEAIQAERQEYRRIVNQWIKEANVETLQDFIRLKGLYEDKKLHLQNLRENSERLAEDEEKARVQRNEVLNKIAERLKAAGLSAEPDEFAEQIQIWKDNLKDYIESARLKEELENENDTLLQKEESLYREISLVCGEDIKTRQQLDKAVELRKEKLDGRELEMQAEEHDLNLIEERIQTVNEKIKQNGLLISRLSAMLENIPDDESLQRIHEKVQELMEEKQRIMFLGEAIETAIQVLSEASIAIQRDYVPSLNREIGNILNTITSGKYKEVNADDRLNLNILSPESPEWVLPEQLSSGTADQVYLALRLAAVRLVEQNGETMPLFFDEPFVQYDEERTENALRLLLDESRTRQVFLFTCKKREVELLMKHKTNEEISTHCLTGE
ncbi:MAG: AAA family ATPase [Clostridiaceae bacterium]|nr:AAA family ATPase [Clostridiaceae bacterium]